MNLQHLFRVYSVFLFLFIFGSNIYAQSELTISYIHRTPEIDFVDNSSNPAMEGWPAVGQAITWEGKIKNWSNSSVNNVSYKWYLNNSQVGSGTVNIPANSEVTVDYNTSWSFSRNELKLVIDDNNQIAEQEENNNELTIFTDAITVGLYVEQTVYDYFRQNQGNLNVGAVCWEDWAHRQVGWWNEMFANSIYADSPNGVLDRIRLDKITIVSDGALPLNGGLPTNNPNSNDKTVDLIWGFPSTLVANGFYNNTTSTSNENPFYREGSLIHELGHARYLVDVYGFNIDGGVPGERIQITENGSYILGTDYMPFEVFDIPYLTPHKGFMNSTGDNFVSNFSVHAMNRIAGHRATQGNQNSPGNIGEFLSEIPTQNEVTIKDELGNVIPNADVKIYQASGLPGVWYGSTFDDTPDLFFTSDNLGKVMLGSNPFTQSGNIIHWFGFSNGVIIVRVETDDEIGYGFMDLPTFNLEYFRGNTSSASYDLIIENWVAKPSSSNCNENITGYTYLGEYDNSKYFISNISAQWQTAQANALANNGYLASINSQEENDFILSNITEIAFIGWNDATSEGTFEWASGEAVTFNNFTDTNSPNNDYGKMNFWNGGWGVDNQFVSRKYIVEIPCDGMGVGIQVNCNLNIDPAELTVEGTNDPSGNVVNWTAPTATTDCPGGIVSIEQVNGLPSGSFFFPWVESPTYLIIYEITDACGNIETCSNEIYVEGVLTEIQCPADITVEVTSIDGAIVNYNPPTVIQGTCSATNPSIINPNYVSGSLFPIGTTTVFYMITTSIVGSCNGAESCSFNITVTDENSGAGCPNDITGFTTLGEFGDSKYYISNAVSRPVDAQAVAEANGGYLVSINSQAENDFIQQGTDGLTYIGLNDQNTEGDLEWFNSEPLTYNNVAPCGFCNENSEDQDFGVIQPWDGGWSFSNFWNQRKFIMEIPCSGGGTDEPDLTVSNLSNLANSGNVGEVISFNFDLNNIGNITATGSYNVNTYISTDNTFSSDDILVGEVPTGDTPVGIIQDVPAAITVPNLADGNYFLIVVADALNQITESNENNNSTFTDFEITTDVPSDGCAYYRNYPVNTPGVFRDFEYVQGSNGLSLVTNTRNNSPPNTEWIFETTELDAEGNALGSTSVTLPTFQKSKFGDYGYESVENFLGQFQVSALQSGGSVLWTTTIDLQTSDPLLQLQVVNQLEVSDHLIVYGVYGLNGGLRRPFVVKLDLNGNEIWQNLLPTFDNIPSYFALRDEAIGGGYYFETRFSINVQSVLIKVDANGNQTWTKNLTDNFNATSALYGGQSPDGSGLFYGLGKSVLSPTPVDIIKIDPATGNNIWEADLGIFSPINFERGEFEDGLIPTSDGGVVTNARLFPTTSGTSENFYGKLDADGNLVWSHLTPTGFDQPPVFETEDGGYIFGKYIFGDNAVDVYKVNSDGTLDPLCDDTGCPTAIPNTTYLGEFSGSSYFLSDDVARPLDAQAIANQYGGYLAVVNSILENGFIRSQINELVYIGINDFDTEGSPEWENGDPLTYTNFDICSFCEGNSADMDFVVMHSWNGGWSWSNFYNQRRFIIEVPCTNSNNLTDPNLGNSLIALPSQEVNSNLNFEKIHPNPASNEIFTFIHSNIEQEVDIQIFDARGTLVKSENVLLSQGKNTTRISISNLPGVFYSIYVPQMNRKVGMKRFVKVRE